MNKQTADSYDKFLELFNRNPNQAWHTSDFTKDLMVPFGFKSIKEVIQAISILLSDGLIEPLRHPSAPNHDLKMYKISHLGVRFILVDGGYAKKVRYNSYEKANVHFTWMRHWLWFIGFILSLLGNIFFMIIYLLKP